MCDLLAAKLIEKIQDKDKKKSHAAIEVFATKDTIIFGGEATTTLKINKKLLKSIVKEVFSILGYNSKKRKKEFDKVHDAISLQKPEDEDFSQILSPMYGTYLPSMQPAKSIPEYKVEDKKANMNLSEMLEKPKKETNKQETLFDKEGE